MKCNLCGKFYSEKKYAKCPVCFPAVKPKNEEKAEPITEAFNQNQLTMVYGEVEK